MTAAAGPQTMTIDGRVEHIDEMFGVSGWAVDLGNPQAELTLELWADDELIDTASSGRIRHDVCDALKIDCFPGFEFGADVGDRIRTAAMRGLQGNLVVRVAGSSEPLASLGGQRSLQQVKAASMGAIPGNRDALIDRLSLHNRDARARFDEPMRPLPGRGIGFVESVAVDDSGLTWVVGWIKNDLVIDRPIVIIDNGRHAAGFAYTLVERSDLPPDSRGFVGILHTEWRASPDLPPYFFLADGSGRFLESLLPTPIRSKQAIAPAVRDLLARAEGGYRDLMRDLFHTVHSWQVVDDGTSRDLLYVDEIAILRGFGAIVTGWTLSPSKESDRFTLKIGNRIMVADDRSIARRSRPDLSSIYTHVDLSVARAGFTAVFRGDLGDSRLDDMVLKGLWTDGTATNAAIPAERVRLLGLTTPIERVLSFYPAIEAESFFADFARHAAAFARTRAAAARPYEVVPASKAVVFVAPHTRSDLALMVDGIVRHHAAIPADWGVAILACPDDVRTTLVSLFADLKRATGRACSLFFADTPDIGNDAISSVLDAVGLDRFAFVGPSAMLTPVGWTALAAPPDGLTLLEIRDLALDPSAAGSTGLEAFVCDAAAWRPLAAAAPPRIGGVALDAATAAGIAPDLIVRDAALSLGTRRPSALVARINEIESAPHE